MQNLSNGEQRVVVEGKNVRQIIESLDQKYPGFKDRLVEDGRVKPNISVAIDGEITPLGMIEKVSEESEVHFLPAISAPKAIPTACPSFVAITCSKSDSIISF